MVDHSSCGNDAALRRRGEMGFGRLLLARGLLRRGPGFHQWSPESHVWTLEPQVWGLEPQTWGG
jgi:hypothetical protein